jgi:hypothetical protein
MDGHFRNFFFAICVQNDIKKAPTRTRPFDVMGQIQISPNLVRLDLVRTSSS